MRYVGKLILKLIFGLMLLLFINNPMEPLSIFMVKEEISHWYPLFQPEAVLYYQKLLSGLVLVGLGLAILEYLYRHPIWEIVEDLPSIIGLYLIRSIPRQDFNFKPEVMEQAYPIFYVVLSILMLLAAVGIILKSFNYVAAQREATKP